MVFYLVDVIESVIFMRNNWTREEAILALSLYCQIPFRQISKQHPEIIRIARLLGRTPSAVGMKIGNFGSFDETLQRRGISGLTNASKLDKAVWDEFNGRWDMLAQETARILDSLGSETNLLQAEREKEYPLGKERVAEVKQRINQNFFRMSVLSSYGWRCCITGMDIRQLLIASHIKPWCKSTDSERTHPQNGLCLNALHDRAFDRGLITVTPTFEVKVSKDCRMCSTNEIMRSYFGQYEGKKLIVPERFQPKKEFLEYHNDIIFEHWKK